MPRRRGHSSPGPRPSASVLPHVDVDVPSPRSLAEPVPVPLVAIAPDAENNTAGSESHPSPTASFRERISNRFRHSGSRSHAVGESADLQRLKERVGQAVSKVVDNVLPIASGVLELAPVPGLALAAGVLESIWESVQAVQSNQWKCLRLTERCAGLLETIRTIVEESGPDIARQIEIPLRRISERFEEIKEFFKALTQMRFHQRYLNRDDILRQIDQYNTALTDSLLLFNASSTLAVRVHERFLQPAIQTSESALLMAPDVSTPTSPDLLGQDDDIKDLPLAGLPTVRQDPLESAQVATDVSSLRERLSRQQTMQNRHDEEKDEAALHQTLKAALEAPSRAVATRILQIPRKDMPAVMVLLLSELERQQAVEKHRAPSTSPSPLMRALTWPLDGLLARQATLLHQGFAEHELEALKRTLQALKAPLLPLDEGALTRIRVHSPSNDSDWESIDSLPTVTAMTTPARTEHDPALHQVDAEVDANERENVEKALAPLDNHENRATELLYRRSLAHAFHHLNVTLPLWTPSPVELGAVGFLLDGVFRTLFNSGDPAASGLVDIPPLVDVPIVRQKQKNASGHVRGTIARGMKLIQHKLRSQTSPGPSSSESGTTTVGVDRTYTFSAFGGTAHLITEKAEYKYWQSLDVPRRWFRAHIDAIMRAVPGNACLKQEIFLVYGTVNARDHAMLVNHGDTEEFLNMRFHVHTTRKPDQPWGYFDTVTEKNEGNPPIPEPIQKVSRVSNLHDPQRSNTVLISRLCFRLHELEPTPT